MKKVLESLEVQGMGDELEVIVQDGTTKYTKYTKGNESLELRGARWFCEEDVGQSDALNKGFAKAKGEWLFWLNADDVLLPGALEKVRGEIFNAEKQRSREAEGDEVKVQEDVKWEEEVKVKVKGGGAVKWESEGVELNWIVGNQLLVDEKGKVVKCSVGNGWHDWLYRHAVPHVYGPSSFFRRELFERVGGIDTSLTYCMDWDLWIRFMKAGARFERIDEYLWVQRQWSGSKTQRLLSADEMSVQQAEIRTMLVRNGLDVTSGGKWLNRAWRMLNGNYLKEWLDTFRMRGKCAG